MRTTARSGKRATRLLSGVLVLVLVFAMTPLSVLATEIEPQTIVDPTADEWFVDPATGNDANTGMSWDQAFETIGQAMLVADGLDVINLGAATFVDEFPITVYAQDSGIVFRGVGSNDTVLDAGGMTRIFEVFEADATFEDMSMINGGGTHYADVGALFSDYWGPTGGAIASTNSSVTVSGCELHFNFAQYGGAISASMGSLTVDDSVFWHNGLDASLLLEETGLCEQGGAIYVEGSTYSVDNSIFEENVAVYAGGAVAALGSQGLVQRSDFVGNVVIEGHAEETIISSVDVATTTTGGAMVSGIVEVINGQQLVDASSFEHNLGYASAIASYDTSLTVSDTSIVAGELAFGSVVSAHDMGILGPPESVVTDDVPVPPVGGSTTIVERCQIAGNQDSLAQLSFVGLDSARVINTLIHHNDAPMGAVVSLFSEDTKVINSTIADNDAHYGVYAGIDTPTSYEQIADVYNSIVVMGEGADDNYTFNCYPYNSCLVDPDPVAPDAASAGVVSLPPGGNLFNVDPMFVSPHIGDYRLMVGSPCIDTGLDFPEAPAEDLDWLSRPVDGDEDTVEEYDMGAYEFFGATSDRLWGPDRYDTAVAISADHFASADTVILATGRTFADGLAASGLAGAHHAPLLLTDATELPDSVAAEIERLGATKVIVVGGTSAVAGNVAADLESMGLMVERIGGADRYETATMIAEWLLNNLPYTPELFMIARGDLFADALTAAPVAYANTAPVLLVEPDVLPPATVDIVEILGENANVVIVGGTSAVSAGVEASLDTTTTRIDGADRYETSANFSEWAVDNGYASYSVFGVATGMDFPDALSGGAGIGSRGGVLLLTPKTSVHSALDALMTAKASEIVRLQLFGGANAVADDVETQLYDYLP